MQQGKSEKVLAAIETAPRSWQRHPEVRLARGTALVVSGPFLEALDDLHYAAQHGFIEARINLAEAYRALGQLALSAREAKEEMASS